MITHSPRPDRHAVDPLVSLLFGNIRWRTFTGLFGWSLLTLFLFLTGCKKEEPETGSILMEVSNQEGIVAGAIVRTQPSSSTAISNETGTAFLNDIPPNDYLVIATHEDLGTADTLATVVGNRTTELRLRLPGTFARPPEIEITFPDPDYPYEEIAEAEFLFRARVSGPENPQTSVVTWESSRDGIFDERAPTSSGSVSFTTSTLSVGTHRVYATATDPLGRSDIDSVQVIVLPRPEPVRIISATGTSEGPRITWSAYLQQGFQSYQLYRQLPERNSDFLPIAGSNQIQDTFFIDTELPYGATAAYRVEVRTEYGIRPLSESFVYEDEVLSIALPGPIDDMLRHPTRNEIYLLSGTRSQVYIIDLNTQTRVATIDVSAQPNDMALDTDSGLLYVAGGGTSFIDVIDVVSRNIERRIDTTPTRNTAGSTQITIGTIGSDYLVVAGYEDYPGVTLLDPLTGVVVSSLDDGFKHIALAIHPNQPTVYVSSGYGNNALRSYQIVAGSLEAASNSGSFIQGGGLFLFLSGNGTLLFYNDRVYDPHSLTTVLNSFNRRIIATNQDGSLVFSSEGVFTADSFTEVFSFRRSLSSEMIYDEPTRYLYAAETDFLSGNSFLLILEIPD